MDRKGRWLVVEAWVVGDQMAMMFSGCQIEYDGRGDRGIR